KKRRPYSFSCVMKDVIGIKAHEFERGENLRRFVGRKIKQDFIQNGVTVAIGMKPLRDATVDLGQRLLGHTWEKSPISQETVTRRGAAELARGDAIHTSPFFRSCLYIYRAGGPDRHRFLRT